MVKYPPVTHKIPELFVNIIAHDRVISDFLSQVIVPFAYQKRKEIIEGMKKKRQELTQQAERFIVKQRTGNG